MQRRPGQRKNLNVEVGLVHQSNPFAGEIEQAPLDLARVEANARVRRCQPNRLPSAAYVRGQIVFLDADQLHACLAIAHGRAPDYQGTVSPCRSMKRKPGRPRCATSVSTTCGIVSSTQKGAFGPPSSVRIQPGAISTIAR